MHDGQIYVSMMGLVMPVDIYAHNFGLMIDEAQM